MFALLRQDIVNGVFEPGSRLAIKALCDRYGVGASPVREALQRLTGEHFVQLVGQRGFRVPALALEDLDEITSLRSLIEAAAVRQAIARGDEAWEGGIVIAFHRLEQQIGHFGSNDVEAQRRYDAAHRQFHLSLCAGAASPRLTGLQVRLYDQAFRYRRYLHREPIAPARVLEEHRRLMKLVLARHADAAARRLVAHLTLTRGPASRHLTGALAA